MTKCRRIAIPRRKVCRGDMDKQIEIQSRNLRGRSLGSRSHNIDFETVATVWSGIVTLKPGTVFFDGVNNRDATHDIYINYIDYPTIDAEDWILYDGDRYDILFVENLEERNEFIRLHCNVRGPADNAVNAQ